MLPRTSSAIHVLAPVGPLAPKLTPSPRLPLQQYPNRPQPLFPNPPPVPNSSLQPSSALTPATTDMPYSSLPLSLPLPQPISLPPLAPAPPPLAPAPPRVAELGVAPAPRDPSPPAVRCAAAAVASPSLSAAHPPFPTQKRLSDNLHTARPDTAGVCV